VRNVHHINVNGDDVPYPIETFSELINEVGFSKLTKLEYPKQLVENLKPYKYEELTAVQMQAIPIMLNV
jgi:superfamily II DNA/RNA helicase